MKNTGKMTKKPVIMSDFDSTMIKQNSLNILTKNIIWHYIKLGQFGRLIAKGIPVLWLRMGDLYTLKRRIPEAFVFDDSDLVIKKAKQLNGIPYSIYTKETIPFLEINRFWLEECLRLQKKYDIQGPIQIVSRNGLEEIKDFFDYSNNPTNISILEDKKFLDKLSNISGKKFRPKKILKKKKITNKDILDVLGLDFTIIANEFCKKLAIVEDRKDLVYTGVVRPKHKLGIIEKKNKALLYEGNIVLADKEELIFRKWAKELICVER
jgi:hypothetical protein